jgi:hypothetical protein
MIQVRQEIVSETEKNILISFVFFGIEFSTHESDQLYGQQQ